MTLVTGDTALLQASLLGTWMQRATERVQSSPDEHVAEMVWEALKGGVLRPVDGSTSDGFHTFDELYRHRMLLTAALFNAWHKLDGEGIGPEANVHKSWRHSDGQTCSEAFHAEPGSWFIVVAQLPDGQISYHYQGEHWDLFNIPERDLPAEFDGHTADDVADRLQKWQAG